MDKADFYEWRDEWMPKEPWARQYLNLEFLEHEVEQIKNAQAWFRRFNNSRMPAIQNAVRLHTVRADLDAGWRANVHAYGQEVGLSALYNQDAVSVVALFPKEIGRPSLRRVVWIEDSERMTLVHPKTKRAQHFLAVEKWHYARAEEPFIDLDVKPHEVADVLGEAIGAASHEVQSLVRPLHSAPAQASQAGGLRFSCDVGDLRTRRARDVLDAIQHLAPPEFRKGAVPASLAQGKKHQLAPGISVLLAERPPRANIDIATMTGAVDKVHRGLRRKRRTGEHSLYSGIVQGTSTAREKVFAPLLSVTQADCSLAVRLDELIDVKADFHRLRRATDSRVMAAVAAAHQYQPDFQSAGNELGRLVDRIQAHAEAQLIPYHQREKDVEQAARAIVRGRTMSLARGAMSFTRSRGSHEMTRADFDEAFRMHAATFEAFEEANKGLFLDLGNKRRRTDARQLALQYALYQGPVHINELWEQISSEPCFEGSRTMFEASLEIARKRGLLVVMNSGMVTWVGGT